MRIGLVLSGGGSRGMAHLGVLTAMDELNLKPTIISGSSAGALIGAMYCAGHSPLEIKNIIEKRGVKRNLRLSFNKLGLFSLRKVQSVLKNYLPENFEDLKTELIVCVSNIRKGEAKYFNEGELIAPVTASCAIPGIFMPVIVFGKSYIDGGILNNLPLEPIIDKCDFTIGVNIMPIEKNMPVHSARDIIMKCLMISIGRQSLEKSHDFDILIQPPGISKFNGLKLTKTNEMYHLGYKTAKELLKNVLSA